ncbi:MAG: hypothetical protein FWH55_05455 [Oscillospiraceae bacterium]|nr:hypothetical protein [Oscillospiraceae bacterium]
MKKSVKIRVFSLIVASVVLCGAVTVAALAGSPYETLKNAMLDAITYRNATMESHMTMSINGFVEEEQRAYEINGDDGFLRYNFDDEGNRSGYNYTGKSLNINPTYKSLDGVQWYYASVHSSRDYYSYGGSSFSTISPDERDSAEMRFMELLLDLMVGDLKNNITMTSEDGVRIIRGSLTESQVPELVKAGIDVAIEQSGSYYSDRRDVSFDGVEYVYEDVRINRGRKTISTWKQAVRPMTAEEEEAWESGSNYDYRRGIEYWGTINKNGKEFILESAPEFINEYEAPITRDDFDGYDVLEVPMKNIVINYIHGEAEVDQYGNLLRVEVTAAVSVTNIFDETDVIDFNASAHFTDIGTSDPVCPIPGAAQLLTPDYMKTHFDNEYISVYFTLNDDGSINEDSVTTAYPGEAAGRRAITTRYDGIGEIEAIHEFAEYGDITDEMIRFEITDDQDVAGGIITVEVAGNEVAGVNVIDDNADSDEMLDDDVINGDVINDAALSDDVINDDVIMDDLQ